MIVLEPVAVTPATLISSTVAETEYPAWAGGTTYAVGDRVMRQHRVRESLIASNVGNDPEAYPDKWLDVGPTNRWAMFDPAAGPQTTRAGQIEVEIVPVVPLAAVGAVDAHAAELRVRVFSGGVAIHDELVPGGGTRLFTGLPTPSDQRIIVSVNPVAGLAAIGKLLIGEVHDFGVTETGTTVSITDYSRRETDDFGVTTIVPRAWTRRIGARTRLNTADFDAAQQVSERLVSKPALWVANPDVQALAAYGFSKGFDANYTLHDTCFAGLTIETLPGADRADSGADPAITGQSDLRVVPPVTITDAILSSSIAEDEGPVWSVVPAYAMGEHVIRQHRVYESLLAFNHGHDPLTDTTSWLDVGPTSRWAMFDEALGTVSSATAAIVVTLTPPTPIDTVALLDVVGASVRLRVEDAFTAAPFDQTLAATAQKVWTGLPKPAGQKIIVTIQPQAGVAQIGTLLIGSALGLGRTEDAPQTSLTDYSRKDTDDFGNTTVVPRGTAKRLNVRSMIATSGADDVLTRMAARRAKPSLWLATDSAEALAIYGHYRDFSMAITDQTTTCGFTIEGLTKAAPPAPPIPPPADGQSAYSINLSNDGEQLPATHEGVVISYAEATTSIQVFYGGEDVTAQFTPVALIPGDGRNPQGLTVTGTYPDFAVTGGFDANEETASFLFRVTGTGAHAGVTLSKKFSLIKSKASLDGTPPPLIRLTMDKPFAKYNAADEYVGGPITLKAVRQNLAAAPQFKFIRVSDGAVLAAGTADELAASDAFTGSSGDTVIYKASHIAFAMTNYGTIQVVAYRDGTAATDSVSIAKVKDGANGRDAYALLLSNESHTVPADSAGNVISYAGASTNVTVLYGGQDVTGLFSLDYPSNPQALSVNDSGFPTIVVTGGLDAGEESAVLTIRMTGTGAHAGIQLSRVFSLAKSRGGANAPLLKLNSSAQVLHLNADGSLPAGTPNFVFTAARQNYGGAVSWAADPNHDLTLGGGSNNGDTLTVTAARLRDCLLYNRDTVGIGLTQKVILSGGGLVDFVTLVGVLDGAAGTPGVSPISVSALPEGLQVSLNADGSPAGGALPQAIGVSATKAGAASTITSITIVSNPGNTASVSGSQINVTAVSGDGEVVFDVVSAGQTVRKRVAVTTTRAGSNGALQQVLAINAPQLTWSAYQQHGGSIAINASAAGKLKLNLTGLMRVAVGGDELRFQSKLQYREAAGTWTDVSGSEAVSTKSETVFEPTRVLAANVNGAGPYTLTGLTANGAYEVRALTRKYDGTAATTATVALSMSAEQVA